MKKILIFSTAYFPFMSGAEMAVDEIAKRANDFEFDLITARMDRKLSHKDKYNNINIYRVGFGFKTIDKFFLPFLGYLKAKKLNSKNDYKIIWPLMASQASIAAAFTKIKFPKIKLLLTLQEGDEEEHLKRYVFGSDFLYKIFIQPWHLLVFKKADYVTAISNDLKQRAVSNRIKCKVEVAPNGVNVERFSIDDCRFSIEEFRNKLGINKGEKVIITVSRLVKKNGIGDLIRAINKLRIKNYELRIKLLVCGIGEDEEKLKSLVKNLKIEDKVLFFGQVPHDELPKYLWISDVFCRPSLSEGLGNSFLEAMAAGTPVIATPVGGIPDFLFDNKSSFAKATKDKTGWFCKVKDPDSIAEKIKYILDEKNKDEVRQVVENARKMIEEKYNWDNIAIKFKEIFNEYL